MTDTRTDQRRELRFLHTMIGQNVRNLAAFIGLNVDQEVIRCGLRQCRLPLGHEFRAHERQQQQDHDADTEGHHLHAAFPAAPRDVGDAC